MLCRVAPQYSTHPFLHRPLILRCREAKTHGKAMTVHYNVCCETAEVNDWCVDLQVCFRKARSHISK